MNSNTIIDSWFEEKIKITNFYRRCFGNEWIPNWDETEFPEIKGEMKRPEFIFVQMTEHEAFDAYVRYFGEHSAEKVWHDINYAIDRDSLQKRPDQNYIILHVGGDVPDMLNYSYDDGISKNIIFMTPLEGIISAFRYRFETGKNYDVVGKTYLSALDNDGFAIYMSFIFNKRLSVDSEERDFYGSDSGFRQVYFKSH